MCLHRGSALCGHSAEQMWEARWAQIWFILRWDWPVLGQAQLWAQHPEHARPHQCTAGCSVCWIAAGLEAIMCCNN